MYYVLAVVFIIQFLPRHKQLLLHHDLFYLTNNLLHACYILVFMI